MSTHTDHPITMPDGGVMNMAVWRPASGHGPGLLLLQEILGIGDHLHSVGERLADAGYVAGAPDVFWRFAPRWRSEADDAGIAASMEQAAKLDIPQSIADCSHALTELAGLPGVEGTPGALGFCLGGIFAFAVAAAAEPSVAVSYYGPMVPQMVDQLASVSCPILFHFGTNDHLIPGDGVEALAAATVGRPNTVVNVEIAGHAFDNQAPQFYDEGAAKAAWAKTMAFLNEHLPV